MIDGVERIHCSFCGAELMFSDAQIERILIVPPCPRCREQTWLDILDLPVVFPSAYK